MSLMRCDKSRGKTFDITIKDANSTVITPGANDKVRATILRSGETPVFTVTSGSPTANGSSVTKGSTNRLRIDASDLTFQPGTYTLIVDYYDNADAQEWKFVEKQTFYLEGN